MDSPDNSWMVLPFVHVVVVTKERGWMDWTMTYDGKAAGLGTFGEMVVDGTRIAGGEDALSILYQDSSSDSSSGVHVINFTLNPLGSVSSISISISPFSSSTPSLINGSRPSITSSSERGGRHFGGNAEAWGTRMLLLALQERAPTQIVKFISLSFCATPDHLHSMVQPVFTLIPAKPGAILVTTQMLWSVLLML